MTQKLKSGQMRVLEVPIPSLEPGAVLVQNFYSLISAGTESSTVQAARKGYIGKAKERPKQVKQVLDTLKAKGPIQTYRAVMKKLDAYSPLGYSCVGKVIGVGEDIFDIRVGDMVACGGKSACHAEVVAVPRNLTVKLPELNPQDPDKHIRVAAYNSLGAIALQGVRQADTRLGEVCAVIGLGLIGQLTCLMLRASGIKTIGIDIDLAMVDMAAKHCADYALLRDTPEIEERVYEITEGLGCDSVIITAATSSLDPINFAGAIARKKATIVVLGAVPTGFDREPHYYKKELTVKMSCSYGPGRYDPFYEDKGIDYPAAYVRWTENRNMLAFQEFVALGKVDPTYLTTHVFSLEDSPKAYDMIMEKSEPFVGILIAYDGEKKQVQERVNCIKIKGNQNKVAIGFIGAGSYAQSYLLPNIPKDKAILKGVMTSSSASARSVADRYGFEFCTSDEGDILNDPDINVVFIATRHNTHSKYVIDALKAGKHVFVEKPLCLDRDELETIKSLLTTSDLRLMVGFNRRFSPLTEFLREKMGSGPKAMIYRVNAGAIPADSWIQDRDVGGGRVHGEVCHFVDYLSFMAGSLPVSVFARSMPDPQGLNDTLSVSLQFANGSIGTVHYFSNGSKSMPKEYVEIYSHGTTGVLNDYREALVYSRGKPKKRKLMTQDKGQKEEVRLFIESVLKGIESPISWKDILRVTEVSFAIEESLRSGRVITFEG